VVPYGASAAGPRIGAPARPEPVAGRRPPACACRWPPPAAASQSGARGSRSASSLSSGPKGAVWGRQKEPAPGRGSRSAPAMEMAALPARLAPRSERASCHCQATPPSMGLHTCCRPPGGRRCRRGAAPICRGGGRATRRAPQAASDLPQRLHRTRVANPVPAPRGNGLLSGRCDARRFDTATYECSFLRRPIGPPHGPLPLRPGSVPSCMAQHHSMALAAVHGLTTVSSSSSASSCPATTPTAVAVPPSAERGTRR